MGMRWLGGADLDIVRANWGRTAPPAAGVDVVWGEVADAAEDVPRGETLYGPRRRDEALAETVTAYPRERWDIWTAALEAWGTGMEGEEKGMTWGANECGEPRAISADVSQRTRKRSSLNTSGASRAPARAGRGRRARRRHPRDGRAFPRCATPSAYRSHPTTPRPAK